MNLKKEAFGTIGGRGVDLYTLTNDQGMRARITNYGGILVSLEVPDRKGRLADVVLGFNRLEDYVKSSPYFGCITGRFANRIAKGKFTLDGQSYTLAANNGPNHLHGGIKGFDKVVWKAEPVQTKDRIGLSLGYVSPDGEEGYPGNLECKVTYQLTHQNELEIRYQAQTDKPTIVNLTHHSYFHLGGEGSGDVLGHELTINADRVTAVDDNLIPTGVLLPVKGTPLDFTQPAKIGARIGHVAGGYDHNFVMVREDNTLTLAARAVEPVSGRIMETWTTEPGIQFYSGNFLDGTLKGKTGKLYGKQYGFCLETQHFPDSPNQASFPTTVLRPGQTYRHETVYKFSSR